MDHGSYQGSRDENGDLATPGSYYMNHIYIIWIIYKNSIKITDSSIRYDFMGRPIKDIIRYDIWGRPIKAVVIVPDNDKDGTPDELDDDDDNDGIPDVFEFEYLGSHKGPWLKNADDKRDIVCPRIKAALTCGESMLRATSTRLCTKNLSIESAFIWFQNQS